MTLGVYAIDKVLFRGEAREVNCVTKSGEITILDHHEPLISLLARGVMKIIDVKSEAHYVPVSSGFLEVNGENKIKILVEEDKSQ